MIEVFTVEQQQGPFDAPEWRRVAGPFRRVAAARSEKQRRERSGKTARALRVMVEIRLFG